MKLGSGLIYHHHRHRHSHSLGSHQLGKMICTKIGLWHMIFRIGLGQTHFEPKMCQTHIEPKSIFLLMLAALYSLLGFSGQRLFGVLTGSSVVFVVFVTGGSVVFVFVLFSQGCITCMIDIRNNNDKSAKSAFFIIDHYTHMCIEIQQNDDKPWRRRCGRRSRW